MQFTLIHPPHSLPPSPLNFFFAGVKTTKIPATHVGSLRHAGQFINRFLIKVSHAKKNKKSKRPPPQRKRERERENHN